MMFKYFSLTNLTRKDTLENLGQEGYEKFTRNLVAAGMGGLEHHYGVDIIEKYVNKYCCKGGENSSDWDSAVSVLTNMYCKRPDTQERTICSLVGKQMNVISGSMSISQDQAQFQAAGGVLKHNSCGTQGNVLSINKF